MILEQRVIRSLHHHFLRRMQRQRFHIFHLVGGNLDFHLRRLDFVIGNDAKEVGEVLLGAEILGNAKGSREFLQ